MSFQTSMTCSLNSGPDGEVCRFAGLRVGVSGFINYIGCRADGF